MVLKGGGRGPTKIGAVPLSDARSERSGGDAARRARLHLVRRYEVFSGVMNSPMAHAPALVEAWGGKTGDISGVVPAMPGGHVGDVCGCCTPGSVPCLL